MTQRSCSMSGEASTLRRSSPERSPAPTARRPGICSGWRWFWSTCGGRGSAGYEAPPSRISCRAVNAAAALIEDYFKPMAARVYGDAALPEADRLAAVFARWILDERPRS